MGHNEYGWHDTVPRARRATDGPIAIRPARANDPAAFRDHQRSTVRQRPAPRNESIPRGPLWGLCVFIALLWWIRTPESPQEAANQGHSDLHATSTRHSAAELTEAFTPRARSSELPVAATSAEPTPEEAPPLAPPILLRLHLLPAENGNYYASGEINEQRVDFLVDTGASYVFVPEQLQWKLGLRRGRAIPTRTAAGTVLNYETRIDRLKIGPIQLFDVQGALNPHAPDNVVLLGMSALRQIQVTYDKNELILQHTADAADSAEEAAEPEPSADLEIKRSVRGCMGPGKLIDRDTLRCMTD